MRKSSIMSLDLKSCFIALMIFSLIYIVMTKSVFKEYSTKQSHKLKSEFKDCGVCFDQLGLEIGTTEKRESEFQVKTIKEADLPTDWEVEQLNDGRNFEDDEGDEDLRVSRFPQALIMGFSKCGTTALSAFLSLHPDIVIPDWEVDFFCDRHYFNYPLAWYRKMMPPSTGRQVTVEKSTCYIRYHKHMERIHAFNSSIRLIVVMRDPIDVLISKHGQIRQDGKSSAGKAEQTILTSKGEIRPAFVDKWGIYVKDLAGVFELFPRKQIHIVNGDQLITDPLTELWKLEEFLGVKKYFSESDLEFDEDKGFFCPKFRATGRVQCLKLTRGRSHADIDEDTRTKLHNYLRPYNEQLYRLVRRSFFWDRIEE